MMVKEGEERKKIETYDEDAHLLTLDMKRESGEVAV